MQDETVAAGVTPEDLRPLMLSIAYRMIGSFSEAEDVVQEAYLRLHQEEVEAPRAWLATVVTRLSIDHLRSARVRREQYAGTWLPEPVLADPAPEAVEAAESLSLAFLVLLESLSPVERAVLILHDVFGYGYGEIAAIVDRSEANCRQLAVRARRRVDERRPRFDASREQRDELAQRFFAAAQNGETQALIDLLAADAAFYGDGGGKAPALPRPLYGREKVARLLVGFGRLARRQGLVLRPAEVNGQPGALALTAGGSLFAVMALDVSGGAIVAVRSIVNPEKLRHLGSASRSAPVR